MQLIPRVHVLSLGTHHYGEGDDDYVEVTPELMDSLKDTYSVKSLNAPVVLGHPKDVGLPSYGWIRNPVVEDGKLYIDLETTDNGYSLISDGSYQNRSLSFYIPGQKQNPVSDGYYIRHLGLLGADIPAVKGLEPINLAVTENDMTPMTPTDTTTAPADTSTTADTTTADIDAQSVELLTEALTSDPNGFTGEIVSYDPTPTVDNNWLWDSDLNQFAGKFTDGDGKTYTFVLSQDQDNNWVKQFQNVDDASATPTPDQTQLSEGSTSALTIDDLVAAIKKAEESEGKNAEAANLAESLYTGGHLKESILPKQQVVELFSSMEGESAKAFVNLLQKRPPLLTKELAVTEQASTPKVLINSPPGTSIDKSGADLHTKAVEFCQKNNMDYRKQSDYQRALRSVAK